MQPTEDDFALIRVLRETFGARAFDSMTIRYTALEDPRLLAALGFLKARVKKTGSYLSQDNGARIRNWLARIDGYDFDGLYLDTDRIGWCYVRQLGEREEA